MANEQVLIKELIRAKLITARREKEAIMGLCDKFSTSPIFNHWEGQETMAQQLLTILDS